MKQDPEELQGFKAYAIQRSRDPSEGVDAKGRAIMACIVLPAPIQKWIVDAGCLEPLIDSIAETIVAAEQSGDVRLRTALDQIIMLAGREHPPRALEDLAEIWQIARDALSPRSTTHSLIDPQGR